MRGPTKAELKKLATYEAEVARGIVHSGSWAEHMADIQASMKVQTFREGLEHLGDEQLLDLLRGLAQPDGPINRIIVTAVYEVKDRRASGESA